jgi:hypothetical protein
VTLRPQFKSAIMVEAVTVGHTASDGALSLLLSRF